jgi:hypothetical protein
LETIQILKLILNAAELTACITGFAYWRKIKATHWRYFPVYLAIIVMAELTGKYLGLQKLYSINLAFYNYFVIPLEILFFIWLFYKEFAHTTYKRLPIAAACIYTGCWITEMFITPKVPHFWIGYFSYTVGILMLLILILAYLYKFVNSKEMIFLKENMMFWVCMGIFVFYSFSLPYFGMGNYLYSHYEKLYLTYSKAIYGLNYIMYGLFTIAFIWGKPKLLSS